MYLTFGLKFYKKKKIGKFQTQTLTLTLLCVRIINVSTSVWRMELSVGRLTVVQL